MSHELTIRVLETPDRFQALEGAWTDLRSTIPSIFLTHWWLATWLEVYAAGAQLKVLTAWSGEKLAGALPLAVKPGGGRTWEFMGSGPLTPNHLDALALPELRDEVLPLIVEALLAMRDGWDVLELDKMDAGSPLAALLTEAATAAGLRTTVATTGRSPYCELPDDFETYFARLGKATRQNARRGLRHLEREHPEARFLLARDAETVERALDALERMHQQRWEGRGYPGSFADPAFGRFQRLAARRALENGSLRMRVLEEGAATVAVEYAFRVGETLAMYMNSFDDAWSHLGPGRLLIADSIKDAIAEGVRVFDYLEGMEQHKFLWCDLVREDVRVRVYSGTRASRLAFVRDEARERALALGRKVLSPEAREALLKASAKGRASRRS